MDGLDICHTKTTSLLWSLGQIEIGVGTLVKTNQRVETSYCCFGFLEAPTARKKKSQRAW